MTSTAIRNKLYDYIRVAEDKKLHAIYNLLENEIEATEEWWNDKTIVNEIDTRYEAMQSGADKGYSLNELEASINQARQKKYGK